MQPYGSARGVAAGEQLNLGGNALFFLQARIVRSNAVATRSDIGIQDRFKSSYLRCSILYQSRRSLHFVKERVRLEARGANPRRFETAVSSDTSQPM
jgi:hypothetical protein